MWCDNFCTLAKEHSYNCSYLENRLLTSKEKNLVLTLYERYMKLPFFLTCIIFILFCIPSHTMNKKGGYNNSYLLPTPHTIMSKEDFDASRAAYATKKRNHTELFFAACSKKPQNRYDLYAPNHFQTSEDAFHTIIKYNISVTHAGKKEFRNYALVSHEWLGRVRNLYTRTFTNFEYVYPQVPVLEKGVCPLADEIIAHNETHALVYTYLRFPTLPYLDKTLSTKIAHPKIIKHFKQSMPTAPILLAPGHDLLYNYFVNLDADKRFAPHFDGHFALACKLTDSRYLESLLSRGDCQTKEAADCIKTLHLMLLDDTIDFYHPISIDKKTKKFSFDTDHKAVKKCIALLCQKYPELKKLTVTL